MVIVETCATCKYGRSGGRWVHDEDIVCVNDMSDSCTEYVTADGYCGMYVLDI